MPEDAAGPSCPPEDTAKQERAELRRAFFLRCGAAARRLAHACDLMVEGHREEAERELLLAATEYEILKQEGIALAAQRRELFEALLAVFGASLGRANVARLFEQHHGGPPE